MQISKMRIKTVKGLILRSLETKGIIKKYLDIGKTIPETMERVLNCDVITKPRQI